MKMRLPFITILLATIFIPMFVSSASACSCVGTFEGNPPCQSYWNTDFIFSGQAVEYTASTRVNSDDSRPMYTNKGRVVRFSVEKAYKGYEGKTIEIAAEGSSCDYPFKEGERYLVYAYRNPANNKIEVGVCGRTTTLEKATEDLAYFQAIEKGEPKLSLYGSVLRSVRPSVSEYSRFIWLDGIKITIEGNSETIETTTDKDGRYQLFDLKDGFYKVSADLPKELLPTDPEYQKPVNITSPRCSGRVFVTTSLGSITGRLLDAQGSVISRTKINLIPVDEAGKEISTAVTPFETYTDAQGIYNLGGLADGRYVVALNPKGQPGTYDPPFARTYYPDVKDLAQAKAVTVVEGQKTVVEDFRLPEPLVKRKIDVEVVWADGTPAANAYLTLVYTERSWLEIRGRTNEQGKVALDAFEGYKYYVFADFDSREKRMHAKPAEIKVSSTGNTVKLVLSEQGRSDYRTLLQQPINQNQ